MWSAKSDRPFQREKPPAVYPAQKNQTAAHAEFKVRKPKKSDAKSKTAYRKSPALDAA